MGSLTFRVARTLVAAAGGALRWLALLAAVVLVAMPLMRVAAGWYVRGRIDLAPLPAAASADARRIAVTGGDAAEVAAVRRAFGSLRYRMPAKAVSVQIIDEDPANEGAAGEYLPYVGLMRIVRSVVHSGDVALDRTVAHEVGHYVDQRYMTDPARRTFLAMRGIPSDIRWDGADVPWERRPDEDFAEVFATLAVRSAVIPPATAYGPVREPGAYERLLRSVGVVFDRDPPPVTWREAVVRELLLIRDTVTDASIRIPLLMLVALYVLLGAIPPAARAWRLAAHDEGVPPEVLRRTRVSNNRIRSTPRTGSGYVKDEGRDHGGGG